MRCVVVAGAAGGRTEWERRYRSGIEAREDERRNQLSPVGDMHGGQPRRKDVGRGNRATGGGDGRRRCGHRLGIGRTARGRMLWVQGGTRGSGDAGCVLWHDEPWRRSIAHISNSSSDISCAGAFRYIVNRCTVSSASSFTPRPTADLRRPRTSILVELSLNKRGSN